MSAELNYLTLVTLLTAIMWIPYILNLIMVRGLNDAVGYPAEPKPLSDWANRMKAAHGNAVENLVVFAALVLVVEVAGLNNETTALACAIYFWARLVHLIVYTLGIPWVRTLAFVTAFGCQVTLALQVLA